MGKGKKRALIMAVLGGMAALSYLPSAEAAGDTGTVGGKNSAMDEYSLDDTIVTAQRTEKSEMDTPATTTVITAEQIKKAGYRNVYEAIDQQIGVTSTSYGETGQDFGFSAGRITLRGYDRGTLVLVNGVPMNLKNYPSTENIPASMVERIEIVKGAASTLYGGEAMGGVINIILKKPQAGASTGSVSVTMGNYFKKTEALYQGDRFLLDVSREWSASIPHSNAFGLGKVSYTDWGVGKGQKNRLGLAIQITDELSFNYDFTESIIGHYGSKYAKEGNVLVAPKQQTYDYRFQEFRQTGNFVYQGKTNGIKAVIGYNYRNVDGYDNKKATALDSNRTLHSEIFDIQKQWNINKDILIAGYSYKHDSVDQTYYNKTLSRSTNSVYASYGKQITNRFTVTLGMRGEFMTEPSKNIALPQIQTDYKFDKDTAWYINIGKVFQMANIDDILGYEEKKYNINALKPEEGWNYETGLKMRRGDETWKFAVYYMDIHDKLGWALNSATNEYYPVDKGDFRNTGVEIEYNKKVNDDWNIRLGASFSNPQIKDPSQKNAAWTQDAGRIEGVIGIDYHQAKWTGNLNLKYLGDREYYAVISTSGYAQDIPSKLQLNLNVDYRCGKNDDITLGVYNLLNRANYSNKYGNLDLDRNFRLTYTHNF